MKIANPFRGLVKTFSPLIVAGLSAVPAYAGQFDLGWENMDWPAQSLGPVTFTVLDEYGYEIQVRIAITQIGGTGLAGYPNDLVGFGTRESLWLVWNPANGNANIGESTTTATFELLSNGAAFPVDGLEFEVSDIDSVDNNTNTDRCDFVTLTGNAGNPTLSYKTTNAATRSVIIGPGPGSGNTGTIAANQAQCVYNLGATGSPNSNADDNGTVIAAYPAGTHSVTVAYDDSIGNVRNDSNMDPAARGGGFFAGTIAISNTSISLQKSTAATSFSSVGETITYSYEITNDGPLPINTGQNIEIQDDKIGTFACGTISAPIPVGGTHTCTADYVVTNGDVAAGQVTNIAFAGVGIGAQAFADRLQSNSSTVTVNSQPSDYSDAPLTGTTYGEARHIIQTGIQLGAGITPENSGYDSPDASGDVDDGVYIPEITQGQSTTIKATVSGAGGYLQGWIDWNDNGSFENSEQVAADLQDTDNDGQIFIPVTSPAAAATTELIARFRWSTDIGLGVSELASDGEVEDYALTLRDPATFTCPAGFTLSQITGNANAVIVPATPNSTDNRALGPIAPAGTNAPPVSAANFNTKPDISLSLTHLVPEGAPITFSLAKNNAPANSDIDVSRDGSVYATQTIFNQGVEEVLEYITVIAPAGGVQFVRILRNGGSVRIDGIQYDHACVPPGSPDLQADKSIAVYDPTNIGLYALPGNDVVYTITVSNAGDGAVDADTIELIDILPSEIEFWNGDIDDGGPETSPVAFTQSVGSGMSLTYGTDVRFGTGTTKPANFAACSVIAPDSSYRPDLTYICLNPKGTLASGDPDPEIALSFRTRIK